MPKFHTLFGSFRGYDRKGGDKLKSCSMCHSKPVIMRIEMYGKRFWSISCPKCQGRIKIWEGTKTLKEAKEAWNRRGDND